MTKFSLTEKKEAFSYLLPKYEIAREDLKSQLNLSLPSNPPEVKLTKKIHRTSLVFCGIEHPSKYIHNEKRKFVRGYNAEILSKELFDLTQRIQEKTHQNNSSENVKAPETFRLQLPTLKLSTARDSKSYKRGISDIINEITQSLSQTFDELLKSHSSDNYKSLEANLGNSRLDSLEQQLKLVTKKESRLEIIQKLANEGYRAAPILRRLIESESDPDIYKKAANVLMLVLK
jgi:hypothetical protein